MAFNTGQGFDCSFGISGSFSGFANVVPKSGKHGLNAKKKILTDGTGTTRGYKYYDPYEELSLEFWVEGGSGNTGTLAVNNPSVGATVTISNCTPGHISGSWSLDKLEFSPAADEVEMGTMTLWRCNAVTPT